MNATTTDQQIRELGDRWVRAEVRADVDALAELSTEDFTLVGPLGFVLDRGQWLQRYRTGELATTDLTWDEVTVRGYGETAVAIGRHTQQATFHGHPARPGRGSGPRALGQVRGTGQESGGRRNGRRPPSARLRAA